MLDWALANAEAASLAEAWSVEDGPGGAIVLLDRDGVRSSASGGFASLEHGLPYTADTPSRFASISKHVLAVCLLRAGVPLDATLGELLDDLPGSWAQVRLGQALDMTGALPDMMEVLWQQGVPFTATLSGADIRAAMGRLPGLNGVPGDETAYSNTGWRLAQAALERRAGMSYAEIVSQLVAPFAPSIRFVSDETEIVPGLASGYWRDGADWRRGRYGFQYSGSGGIAGSAAALAHWGSALLAGRGSLAGMLARLTTPRHFNSGAESSYRLGLVASSLGGVRLAGHGGSLPGYRNHMLLAPALGVGVVVMTNREEEALWPAMRVLAVLLGQPLPRPALDAPTGLFVEDSGPFWAELSPGAISVMGGYEQLFVRGATGLRSLPAYLDIDLTRRGEDVLEGTIGGVPRTLRRASPQAKLDPRLIGHWRDRYTGARLRIRADGAATMPWVGASGLATALTPLPGGRALAELVHGPWRHRPCLWLQPDGSLRLVGHRARVLQFDRHDDEAPSEGADTEFGREACGAF